MNRRRLDAEGVRDAMLAVSGELNPKMGGPGVLAPIEKEVEDLIFTEAEVVDLWPEDRDPAEHLRRSLYLFRKRNVRYPLFEPSTPPTPRPPARAARPAPTPSRRSYLLNSEFAAAGRGPWPAASSARPAPDQDDGFAGPTGSCCVASPRPTEVDQARRFLATQAELLREQAQAGRAPGSRPRSCIAGSTRPKRRPGSISPWRCSTAMSSCTFREKAEIDERLRHG